MLIKICGITKVEEVLFLNELGVDYIGLVFAESKRKISIDKGKELLAMLSNEIIPVAVFRNNSLEYIKEVVFSLNIRIIQLHGEEDDGIIKQLKKLNLTLWKGVCLKENKELVELSYFEKVIYDGDSPGSGQEVDLTTFRSEEPFILSGGLTPLNISEKLRLKNLIGVDVSSGVEGVDKQGNRVKDYKKCKEFIERVKEYENCKG